MSTAPDFSNTALDQLHRSYRFHANDCGTTTMQEEMRRMYLLQEIGAELERRGIPPEDWGHQPRVASPLRTTPSDGWTMDDA